jgi:hypothetical protein
MKTLTFFSIKIFIALVIFSLTLKTVTANDLPSNIPYGFNNLNNLINDNFNLYNPSSWNEGSIQGNWFVQFTGYGQVGIERDGDNIVTFQIPKKATRPEITHASLVTTRREFSNIDLTLKVKTVKQIRTPAPNQWETAWVLWNYKNNTHFYYFTLKTNGWELGKADPKYPGAQRFLKTGETPYVRINSWNEIRIIQQGPMMSIWVDEIFITSFLDNERPYLSGAVGLYNEDSHVRFDDIEIKPAMMTLVVQN